MNCADLNYHVTTFFTTGVIIGQNCPISDSPSRPPNWVFEATISVENESKQTVNGAKALT